MDPEIEREKKEGEKEREGENIQYCAIPLIAQLRKE